MNIIINGNIQNSEKILLEEDLQNELERNPEILKVDKNMTIVCRELGLSTGRADAIGINDSFLYIIETKLHKNNDRRNVLAQVFDYATDLNNQKPEHLFDLIRKKSFDKYKDEIDSKKEIILQHIKNNEFVFVILMDDVSEKLKQIISFVNENSRFSIYAVEFNKFTCDGKTIYVPLIHGGEAMKKGILSSRKSWDLKKFEEEMDSANKKSIEDLVNYCISKTGEPNISFGTGKVHGAIIFTFPSLDKRSLLTVKTNGEIIIQDWVPNHLKEKFRIKFTEWGTKHIAEDRKMFGISVEDWKYHLNELTELIDSLLESKNE